MVKNINFFLFIIPLAIASLTFSCANPSSEKTPHPLLAQAQNYLTRLEHTDYQHDTEVKPEEGIFLFDCSGFLDYLLADVDNYAYQEILSFAQQSGFREDSSRALAYHYVLFADSLQNENSAKHWQAVPRATSIQPGDILAWQKPTDVGGDDTGHVMLIQKNLGQNDGELLLRVIDSASSKHADDERCPLSQCDQPEAVQGLGVGTIGLRLDHDDSPTSYRWSGGMSYSEFHETKIRALRYRDK